MNPEVSIIIPMYNGERTIGRCLESVCSQSFKDIEVIVIDDGSDDKGCKIVERIAEDDKRIHLFINNHQGIVLSRRFGVNHSTGDYVMFVDCDDTLEEMAIDYLVSKAEEYGSDIVVGQAHVLNENGNNIGGAKRTLAKGFYYGNKMKDLYSVMISDDVLGGEGVFGTCWASLFKKSLLEISIMEIPKEIGYGEDAAIIYLSLLNSSSVLLSDEYVYNYYKIAGTTSKTPRESAFREIRVFYDYMKMVFDKYDVELQLIKQLKVYTASLLRIAINANFPFEVLSQYTIGSGTKEIIKGKRVVIYGMGKAGKSAYNEMMEERICSDIILVDENKHGEVIDGITILSPEYCADDSKFDYIILAHYDPNAQKQMCVKLEEMGVDNEKILSWMPKNNERVWRIVI